MKKVLYLATMLLCMAFTSCQKEDIGGTATESLAGDWYVEASVEGNFWDFKIKATSDVNSLTFSATDALNLSYDDCTVTVTNAKILKNGGVQKNGSPADLISMDVEYSDDPGTIYHLEGVRYSGLEEND